MRVRSVTVLVALLMACKGQAPSVTATTWPEADAMFHSDERWLGADGAYSVDLGGDRTLWLFGDTYLAKDLSRSRDNSYFLRNTVGVQTGRDPSHALCAFYWGADADGGPRSFIDQDGSDWFWPQGGARIGGVLLLFWSRVRTPADDPSGFEQTAWRVLVVDDPDDEPTAWMIHDARLPVDSAGVSFAGAVMVDGGQLYAYGETDGALPDLVLARWSVESAALGDLSTPEWWCGNGWSPSCGGGPAIVVHTGAPELSVHADGRLAPFVMVQSEGYGATTLALRTSPAPEGPWSDPQSFFRPPESLDDNAFVYAGKAHPELRGADLVATYVPSVFGSVADDADLYRPHFVRITYR